MSPEDATWVRANAWLGGLDSQHTDRAQRCRCQWGVSTHCQHATTPAGHANCPTSRFGPIYEWETRILGTNGQMITLAEPYRHPTRTYLGAFRLRFPYVWLGDRICRWICPCPCHVTVQERLF